MTAKSTREEIKQRIGLPCNVYKELICEAPVDAKRHSVMAPRNIKQVQNAQATERQKFRLGRDAFYNLHLAGGNTISFCEVHPNISGFHFHNVP